MRKIVYCLMVFGLMFIASCSKDAESPDNPNSGGNEETGPILPKKELRGVWMATVFSIDWPRTADFSAVQYNAVAQKKSYTDMLDNLKTVGFNSVFVQVRGMGDAFYQSAYEPWSGSITGVRGQDPGYDVLKFMVDEAHARGIEFHAWINPYRISTRAASTAAYPALHSSVDPSWVVNHEKIQIYNPALPEVRQRLADIVKDLVTKYDVDGLHMDDYFYPDPSSAGVMVSDKPLYDANNGGFSTIEAWRRNNVDKAIEMIYQTVSTSKPGVVFSISPAASKDYNYNTLYADVEKWCKNGWVDVLIPQLYHEVGNPSNNFQTNLSIWAQYAYSAKLVIGHGLYKFGNSNEVSSTSAFFSINELVKQFDLSKKNKKAVGSVMYSARDVYYNRIGITDKLKELYAHPAIIPFAGRQVASPTAVPANFTLSGNTLSWSSQGANVSYAVYHFVDLTKVGKLVAVTSDATITIEDVGHYCVTSLNIDHLESKPTSTIEKK